MGKLLKLHGQSTAMLGLLTLLLHIEFYALVYSHHFIYYLLKS